jgi:hypothetical protein
MSPGPLAASPDGKTVYVLSTDADSYQSLVIAVSVANNTSRRLAEFTVAATSLALSPNGRTLFVGGFGEAGFGVQTIDASTGTLGNFYGTGDEFPVALVITPDAATLWAKSDNDARGDESLLPITISTGKVGDPITLPPTGGRFVANYFHQVLVITPDGTKAYVIDDGGSVFPVDLVARLAGTAIPLGAGHNPAAALAVTPDGRTVEVASTAVTPIDVRTNVAGTPVPVYGPPVALSVTPDQAPTALLTAVVGVHGHASSFNASHSHAATGRIKTYTWQFGDGHTARTAVPKVVHVYRDPGAYVVTLTVTDTSGTSTAVVFTDQSVLRNGGPSARTRARISVE